MNQSGTRNVVDLPGVRRVRPGDRQGYPREGPKPKETSASSYRPPVLLGALTSVVMQTSKQQTRSAFDRYNTIGMADLKDTAKNVAIHHERRSKSGMSMFYFFAVTSATRCRTSKSSGESNNS